MCVCVCVSLNHCLSVSMLSKPVLTVLSKLFEAVLLGFYGSFLTSSSLRYGFKKNSSCNHALSTFVESMKYFTKHGSKIFCAFLDASKAFDKVLINGLLTKLIHRNVPYMFIQILYNWQYANP